MKICKVLGAVSLIIMLFTSCSMRVYTAGSNLDPVTQLPPNVKEKGDLNVEAYMNPYRSNDFMTYSEILGESILYRKTSQVEFGIGGHYALTDKLSLGLKYKAAPGERYQSHSILGSANFFKNYDTRKGKAIYGFDLMGSFQYKTAKNFMSVDQGFIDLFFIVLPEYTYFPFVIVSGDQLSYYRIRQNQYRFIFQPSFTVEHKWVTFSIGGAVAFQHLFRYAPTLQQEFVDYVKDIETTNPMVYYQNGRADIIGGAFLGMGIGPEIFRFNWKYMRNWSGDKLEDWSTGFLMGFTSNMQIKRGDNSTTLTPSF